MMTLRTPGDCMNSTLTSYQESAPNSSPTHSSSKMPSKNSSECERLTSRRQQMMPQARLRKASWMSSRISQQIRSRRNQWTTPSLLEAVSPGKDDRLCER